MAATAALAVATAAMAANPTISRAASSAGATSRLLFGIYPGAGGNTGAAPDNFARDLAGVQQLDSSGAPFLVHLYAEYFGPNTWTAQQLVGSELGLFAQAGIKVELVLRYSPNSANAAVDVPGFVAWVDQALRAMGSKLSYVQITNEANVNGGSANDGTYQGADQALVDGIEAAKSYIVAHRLHAQVGFNWSYDASANGAAWWSQLAALGGSTFSSDVNWVGVDTYPGTWQPLPSSLSFGSGVGAVTTQALNATRSDMSLAHLGAAVPIHVTEVGYPTGPGRTYAMQQTAVDSEVGAVLSASVADNVTAVEFFDLRDAITNSTDFNDQYGLMTDQWTPKPAFTDYQSLVTHYGGAPASSTTAATTTPAALVGATTNAATTAGTPSAGASGGAASGPATGQTAKKSPANKPAKTTRRAKGPGPATEQRPTSSRAARRRHHHRARRPRRHAAR